MHKKVIRFVDNESLLAFGLVVGTAVGAGIFSLPFVVSKAGFFPSMILLFYLGALILINNLMYGEITLRTRGRLRLVGYARKYLGYRGKQVAAFVSFLSFYSSLLIYIILGGTFLHALLSPLIGGSVFVYSLVFFLFSSFAIYLNLSLFSFIESWMTFVLIFIIIIIFLKSAPSINLENFLTFNINQFFFPFGAMLFSMGAISAIPELENIVKHKKERIKSIITYSTVSYVLIYAFFIVAVLGVTGNNTTEESFIGLNEVIGNGFIIIGFIFGVLAVMTSYLTIGISLKETFWYDYKLGKNKSWFLTCFIPFFIFALGVRDFIDIITFAGSITGGLSGILITLIFYRAKISGDIKKPAFEINFSKVISSVIILTYFVGMVLQVIYR